MLSYQKFNQILLVLILNSIILLQVKPMAKPIRQQLDIGVCPRQGPRRTMEDEYQIIENWGNTGIAYAAVFDGHSGNEVAEDLKKNLHVKIFEIFKKTNDLKEAIRQGCAQINQEILEAQQLRKNTIKTNHRLCRKVSPSAPGSCAIIAFIFEDKIIIANVGDSRAVISKNNKAIQLSTDHKPNVEEEQKRIEDAGGNVCIPPNGIARILCCYGLAISRAFGDIDYETYLTAKPQITEYSLPANSNNILILASDGLWDVMQNQEVVDIAKNCENMQKASDVLGEEAIENKHSRDNVTIITIKPIPQI